MFTKEVSAEPRFETGLSLFLFTLGFGGKNLDMRTIYKSNYVWDSRVSIKALLVLQNDGPVSWEFNKVADLGIELDDKFPQYPAHRRLGNTKVMTVRDNSLKASRSKIVQACQNLQMHWYCMSTACSVF